MTFLEEEIKTGQALYNALYKHGIEFEEGSRLHDLPEGFAVVYYSPSTILSETPKGIVNFYNLAAERIFGYSREEAMGMPTLSLVPKELRAGRENLFHRVLNAQKPEHVATERLIKSGERINISAWVFPYEWKPNEFSIAALVRKEK